MVLGYVSDTLGYSTAKTAADNMEYVWNEDPSSDPFA